MKKSILLALILLSGITASATETRIIVRAKAKDAKFIGSSLGGAMLSSGTKPITVFWPKGKPVAAREIPTL